MIMASGKLRCMGANISSQLGEVDNNVSPAGCREKYDVDLGPDAANLSVVDIAMGGYHSAEPRQGFTCALLSNGTLKCWGLGGFMNAPEDPIQAGWLGDGERSLLARLSSTSKEVPLQSVARVDSGYIYTCAVRVSDNAIACWGFASQNRLVSGGESNVGDDPNELETLPWRYGGVSQLALGPTHACALTASSNLYCWGENGQGSIGKDPSPEESAWDLAATNAYPVLQSATAVVAGYYHTCAVANDGTQVYCWGGNTSGQLGIDTQDCAQRSMPTLAARINKAIGQDETITQMVAGFSHNCVLVQNAKESTTRVLCWGDEPELGCVPNDEQVGLKSIPDVNVGERVIQLSAHLGGHTCALLENSEVWCWGKNLDGQSGCKNMSSAAVDPQKVEF